MAGQQILMAFNNLGGIIQGNFGTYQAGADGTATVDSRDIPAMLLLGAEFIAKRSQAYTFNAAPLIATGGQIHTSGALANGAVAITNQPDVMRQVAVRIGAGTSALTAGSVAITYVANDGLPQTDTISAIVGASAVATTFLTKGVERITTMVASGIVGGANPFIIMDITATLAVPVDPGAQDFVVRFESTDNTANAPGTASLATLGAWPPVTAPNSTHTYTAAYSYITPTV